MKTVLVAYLLCALTASGASPRLKSRAKVATDLEQRTDHRISLVSEPLGPSIPPEVRISDGVSREEAVALALWNNASFQEALTQLGVSRADVIQSGLLSNPTLSVLFPVGPKQLEFAAQLPIEAIWLRPRRMAVARLEERRIAQSLVQYGLDLVRDVKNAHTEFLLAKERLRLGAEASKVRARIADIAETRLKSGDISELEASTARLDTLFSREEMSRLSRDVTVAQQRLQNATGLGEHDPPLNFVGTMSAPRISRDTGILVKEAFAARPDLRAAELGIESTGKRIGLAQAEIFTVTAGLDANVPNNQRGEYGPSMQIPIPIFNWNQAARARARAEFERATWHYAAVRQAIAMEVKDSHVRYKKAAEEVVGWQKEVLPELEKNVQRAEEAYAAGDATLQLVLENTRHLLAGRLREVEVAGELSRALAELERSVGHRLERRRLK